MVTHTDPVAITITESVGLAFPDRARASFCYGIASSSAIFWT